VSSHACQAVLEEFECDYQDLEGPESKGLWYRNLIFMLDQPSTSRTKFKNFNLIQYLSLEHLAN
jgi:hypothetical protein